METLYLKRYFHHVGFAEVTGTRKSPNQFGFSLVFFITLAPPKSPALGKAQINLAFQLFFSNFAQNKSVKDFFFGKCQT